MNQKELIDILSKKICRSAKDTQLLYLSFVDVVKEHCGTLDGIAIPRFGILIPSKKEEYITVNPNDGKRYLFPPKITVSYSASNILKNKIKERRNG